MSGINRFLSISNHRHGKDDGELDLASVDGRGSWGSRRRRRRGRKRVMESSVLGGLFVNDEKTSKRADQDEAEKFGKIQEKLSAQGITTYKDSDVAYAFTMEYTGGDGDKVVELLLMLEDSEDGLVRPYDPEVKLLGAVNREAVTCYLDSLLFALFATLGSFEAMLYNDFEDDPRKKLAVLLRLWVNILRAGKLVTVDITKQIQVQIANCGWKEAAELCQQDVSEAFTFITDTLALPLLTLKMDIFHTGKEDVKDDHKLIKERLLELAIPEQAQDGHVITLEECLEMYFNNKIEVKRYLDLLERRTTSSSVRSKSSISSMKGTSSHIETSEVAGSQPSSPMQQSQPIPIPLNRPALSRQRAPSIIQEHYIDEKRSLEDGVSGNARTRKEVMMPAWQFFRLIPWYTNDKPTTDAQVAAHFSSTRPVLGICLKRYSVSKEGTATKRGTHIDIPLEIGLPHFISDDDIADDGPAFGNFKLCLQSVVCHQGVSVDSGHYIAYVRAPGSKPDQVDRWLKFDDLAPDRVVEVLIGEELKRESPYLLFYQVVPIEEDLNALIDRDEPLDAPPSYADSTAASSVSRIDSVVGGSSWSNAHRQSSETTASEGSRRGRSSMTLDQGFCRPSIDNSSDLPSLISNPKIDVSSATNDDPVSSASASAPISRTSTSNVGNGAATTDGPQSLTASRRGSKVIARHSSRPNSKDRSHSSSSNRLSHSLSRLATRMSKDRLSGTGKPSSSAADSNRPSLDLGSQVPFRDPVAGASTSDAKPTKLKSKHHHLHHHHRNDSGLAGEEQGKEPERECLVM